MPDWTATFRERLARLRLPAWREAEIVEELAQHADDRFSELRLGGVSEADAERLTLDELGDASVLAGELEGVERQAAEEPVVPGGGDRRGLPGGLVQDVRFGFRTLRRTPAVTVVAMLALALGIGANTALFSVVNGVLLRPLAYADPGRLVMVYETTREFTRSSVAYPNFLDWRRDSRSFAGMAAVRWDDFNFTGAGEPERLVGAYVSAGFFRVLGVPVRAGRAFSAEDDRQGAGCVAVLTYGLWQRRFGADPGAVGRSMTLNASSCTVIGILPAAFRFRGDASVYVPMEQWTSASLHDREVHPGMRVIARLAPGLTMAAAAAEMSSLAKALAREYPQSNAGHGAAVVRMQDDMVGYIRSTLLLLAGAVGFVLLIACANVANLLMARSSGRRREFAIRSALGASRGRLVRQLLIESVLLASGAALGGWLLAGWGTRLMLAAVPDGLPRQQEIGLDGAVLLFTVAVTAATGIVSGLAAALHAARVNPQPWLKEGAAGAGGGRHRTERVFVAVEVGLAVILLVGAGLMIRTVSGLLRVNPGFDTGQILTAQVALSPRVVTGPPLLRTAYQQMLARVAAIPGVRSVAITSLVPLGESDSEIPFWPGEASQPPQDKTTSSMFYIVSPDYPRVMGIPLRAGRFFDDHDTVESPPVVVIDEVMARHVFPGQDPIGKRLNLMLLGPVRIVGVVGHVKHWGLDTDDTARIRDQIYFPVLQVPDKYMSEAAAGLTLALRTGPDPSSLVPAVRAQVAGPTEDQPIYAVRTMDEIVAGSLAERRFAMLVLMVFAASALLLSAIGVYGVMSHAVSRRTHELGIRATLGASRRDILTLMVREGMIPAAAGAACGLAAALLLARLMTGLLFGVSPADPVTLAVVPALLGAVAFAACYVPARRATRVDPVVALRSE